MISVVLYVLVIYLVY